MQVIPVRRGPSLCGNSFARAPLYEVMGSEEYYRLAAWHARELAETTRSVELRTTMLKMAEAYEQLAAQAEVVEQTRRLMRVSR
jgi:hypothetical protein